jgi:hypothetical protein
MITTFKVIQLKLAIAAQRMNTRQSGGEKLFYWGVSICDISVNHQISFINEAIWYEIS